MQTEDTEKTRSVTDGTSVTLAFEQFTWVLHATQWPVMVNIYTLLFCIPFKHE